MEGLNNLKLNGEMLASLYGHSIIDPGKNPASKADEDKLGKTLIFFRDFTHSKLPEKQLKFLEQILKACKINLQGTDILNLADSKVDVETIIGTASPEHILSFGTGAGTELFSLKNNRGTKYLNAPDLSELMQETPAAKQLKAKLWAELKAIFNL